MPTSLMTLLRQLIIERAAAMWPLSSAPCVKSYSRMVRSS